MKKLITVLALFSIILSGCGSIYSNFREVEQLKLIETMGLDTLAEGVLVTLASAPGKEDENKSLCISGTGSSVSDALDKIKSQSGQEDLFFAHIKRILIGERAAEEGIENFLKFICRSPELRVDIPIFIVKDSTAAEAMESLSSGDGNVSDIMRAAETNVKEHNNSQIFSSAEIINNLSRYDASLICAVECREGENKGEDSKSTASAAVAGYGIFSGSRLCGYLDIDEAVGAGFLMNRIGISSVIIDEGSKAPTSLEISGGSSKIIPLWDEEGSLSGIDIYADVRATVLEAGGYEGSGREERAAEIISSLESEISSRIGAVLQLSRKLQTDFLGLAGRIEKEDPVSFRASAADFKEILPALELRVSVSGELNRTKDIKDA